jgi:nitrogen fixation/metabolism regulation signal transduction histidine kinase
MTRSHQTVSRALRYGLLLAVALSGVLLFLLASAAGNTAFFERNYPVLLAVNGVIAGLLFVLVLVLLRRLIKRLRARRFGARMMMRFSIAFALMGVLPGVLIYIVSTQFLSRSIESWFDVRVDRALDSGLTLGRAVLDNLKEDVSAKARAWALELSDIPESAQLAQLNRLREQGGIQEALLVSANGQLIGASGAQVSELVPEIPATSELRKTSSILRFASSRLSRLPACWIVMAKYSSSVALSSPRMSSSWSCHSGTKSRPNPPRATRYLSDSQRNLSRKMPNCTEASFA